MDTALILTGGDPLPARIVDEIPVADLVVAADSGYDQATRLGIPIDVLVGDLDSLQSTEIPDHVLVELHPAYKDATDLELAIELVVRDQPQRLIVAGGGGGRLDHELATAELLCSPRWAGIEEIDWFSGRARAAVIRGRRILHGDSEDLITLIPVGGDASGISTVGLRWNLQDESLPAGTTRGVSNLFAGPVADIIVGSGCLLAVMPWSR